MGRLWAIVCLLGLLAAVGGPLYDYCLLEGNPFQRHVGGDSIAPYAEQYLLPTHHHGDPTETPDPNCYRPAAVKDFQGVGLAAGGEMVALAERPGDGFLLPSTASAPLSGPALLASSRDPLPPDKPPPTVL